MEENVFRRKLNEKTSQFFIKKYKNWYFPNSGIWNERYMDEKKDVLTTERNIREFNIIKKYIKEKKIKILDAPCGYGRISNLLSALGHDVTGIDINGYFIDIAKEEAQKKKLKINYQTKDIFDLNDKNKYDLVTNIFTSIGYFGSEERNELFIKKLCNSVKSKGTFIIETINPFGILKVYKNREKVITKNETSIFYERFLDYQTSVNITKITEKRKNGKIFKGVNCIRLYYPHELIKICGNFGLRIVDVLDNDGKKENIFNSLRMWFIFKKRL